MRERIKRRERTSRIIIISILVAVLSLAVIAAYLLSTLNGAGSQLVGKPISTSLYSQMHEIAVSNYAAPESALLSRVQNYSGGPFTTGGRPIVVYVGAEFCPFCAFQRWPLILALMRFGNFSNLHYMISSEGNHATFTFVGSSYISQYVVFQPYEQEDNSHQPLQTVPANYSAVFTQFGSSYPFLDFANRYTISGSLADPSILQGNWTQIIQQLNGATSLKNQVIAAADTVTTAICRVTSGNPTSICTRVTAVGLPNPPAYTNQASASLIEGAPRRIPAAWARVQ